MKLSHIDKLESESIHIIREVVAEFDNPVCPTPLISIDIIGRDEHNNSGNLIQSSFN